MEEMLPCNTRPRILPVRPLGVVAVATASLGKILPDAQVLALPLPLRVCPCTRTSSRAYPFLLFLCIFGFVVLPTEPRAFLYQARAVPNGPFERFILRQNRLFI